MSLPNIIIGLCVKNNEFGLPYVLNNIRAISTIANIKLVVAYDNSVDKSLDIIQSCGINSVILNINNTSDIRTQRIAYARNAIIEYIRSLDIKPQYFIMMDSNEYSCIGPININVLSEAFSRKDEWDSISFNREAGYYDTWALSYDPYIFSFFHFPNWHTFIDKMREDFNKKLESAGDSLIEVWSAFNGFAIYKTNIFINCNYSSIPCTKIIPRNLLNKQISLVGSYPISIEMGDCEHRAFHISAIVNYGARIRVMTKHLFSKCHTLPEGITLRGPA
jgi:hypothetical protein